jgi:hypothetical protein
MAFADRAQASAVRARGLVSRIYGGGLGGVDSAVDFATARFAGGTHVATNRVSFEEDAWSKDALEEPGSILAAAATSGDLGDASDSALFAYEDGAPASAVDESWSALVSVPSSHVAPLAKACLVARADDDPAAAGIAVCRPFDEHPPRAQIRRTHGGSTESIELPATEPGTSGAEPAGLTAESPAFLKLALHRAGTGTDATALASSDGAHWTTITTVHLRADLPFRGIGVSSNGRPGVKGLFANLVCERDGSSSPMAASSLRTRAVGHAVGRIFDRLFPH